MLFDNQDIIIVIVSASYSLKKKLGQNEGIDGGGKHLLSFIYPSIFAILFLGLLSSGFQKHSCFFIKIDYLQYLCISTYMSISNETSENINLICHWRVFISIFLNECILPPSTCEVKFLKYRQPVQHCQK